MSGGLRLYNTLTRTKEDFVPIDATNVRMYVCGPTVYDFAHIGNARPVIVFDVLYRLLRHLYGEKAVTYVRNITDVDDKINARALRDHPGLPLNEAIRLVTERTAAQFHEDVAALGCLAPTVEPRATEFVLPRVDGRADMASLIQSLIDRGHAYEANGEILFRVGSMADYGKLSGRNLEDNIAGARVAVDAHKENAADFVLWKQSAPDEPGWDASFRVGGVDKPIRGRPGWHIECSAMSAAYLGEVFDIHGGGLDLIFPHHENEIAQSRCAHGTDRMANYWLHNGFLQVEGKKMSKSEGNFVTIHELLHTKKFGGRKWPGEVLRLAMLMTHYREPIDFSVRRLEEAEAKLVAWNDALIDNQGLSDFDELRGAGQLEASLISAPLTDDVNTVAAIAAIDHARKQLNSGSVAAFAAAIANLGIDLGRFDSAYRETMSEIPEVEEIGRLVAQRRAHIEAKDWAEADKIRNDLLSWGIQLKDGKDPATGERVTTWEVKR